MGIDTSPDDNVLSQNAVHQPVNAVEAAPVQDHGVLHRYFLKGDPVSDGGGGAGGWDLGDGVMDARGEAVDADEGKVAGRGTGLLHQPHDTPIPIQLGHAEAPWIIHLFEEDCRIWPVRLEPLDEGPDPSLNEVVAQEHEEGLIVQIASRDADGVSQASVMPASATWSRTKNKIGLFATGSSCFAMVYVSGRKRTPFPPDRMSAFTATPPSLTPPAGAPRTGRQAVEKSSLGGQSTAYAREFASCASFCFPAAAWGCASPMSHLEFATYNMESRSLARA